MESLDNPLLNDNRNYDFTKESFYTRAEFPIISEWINTGAKIIDLGCGNGSLLKYLEEKKSVKSEGLEISQSGVDFCLENKLKARRAAIDELQTYANYGNQEFDYAICNVTIQMLMYPEILIQEMKRISRYQIISFPNFAYFENRLELLLCGVMPQKMLYKYRWYNTGHIHQLSIRDFLKLCDHHKIKIIKEKHLGFFGRLADFFRPNLFSKVAIYLCQTK